MTTLLYAAEGTSPMMFAEIALRRALGVGKPKPPKAPRREVAKK
jgi:hypothetical protein